MTVAAIIPLRSLHDGKRRLADVLPAPERSLLVQRLFARTYAALHPVVDQIAVVSPDPALLDHLAWADVQPIVQPSGGLNAGLELARRTLLTRAPLTALLVVLPDLPLVTAADFEALLGMGGPSTAVFAPDRHARGTNALLQQPADALPFAFGDGSLGRHVALAAAGGLRVQQYIARGTAYDVDTADDLRQLGALDVPLAQLLS